MQHWVGRRYYARWLKTLPPAEPLTITAGSAIAIVGNGPIAPELSEAIDEHDIVLRFNDCRSYGIGGHRTDILVIGNASPTLAYDKKGGMKRECLGPTRLFWLAIPPAVAKRDHTEEIVMRYVGSRPWQHFDNSVYSGAMDAIRSAGAPAHSIPSTGFLALWHLKTNCPSVTATLFGFTHSGTPRHAWDAEREIVDGWGDWLKRPSSATSIRAVAEGRSSTLQK